MAGTSRTSIRTAGAVLAALALAAASTQARAGEADMRIAIGVTPEGVSCVLGGAIDGELVPASRLVARMSHGQDYTLVGLDGGMIASAAVGKPAPVAPEADCEDQFAQELAIAPDELGQLRTALYGLRAAVTPMLARTRLLDDGEIEALKLDIRVYLDESGFLYSGVEIVQAIEFEANGDGVADVLINAINSKRQTAQRGEYAIIILKDGATGQFWPLAEEFTDETANEPSLLWENTIVTVLDLDGDRRMEVVVYGSFYYGDGWEVLRITEPGGEVVFGCGCGG
jgi:hypothetical protein